MQMKRPSGPMVLAVVAAAVVVMIGLYFTWLAGSLNHAGDPNCMPDISQLDASGLAAADLRCRYSYNLHLSNDEISYNSWTYAHRSASLNLQLFSTGLMLAVVILVVFFGLAMSYLEFQKGTETSSTIKIGAASLEVSSTVIGLVILAISLAFSFLYFDKAYKISELGAAEDTATSSSTSPPVNPAPSTAE
jgi:hypothetical protein